MWDYTDEPCHLVYSSFSSPFIWKIFFFYVSIVHTSAHFQKKNQSQELWRVSEKGCVCMLHVKHSENKVPGKWDLKHKRYFHAQLLHITDIMRCRSPPRPTRFRQKKSSFHVARQGQSSWRQASHNEATVPNQQQAQQSTHARHTSSPRPIRFCQKISTSPKLL